MSDDLSLLRRRLHYQAGHRGTKELDIVLGRFAEAFLAIMSEAECRMFDALLNEQETQVWQWLTQQEPVPEQYRQIVELLLQSFISPSSVC
ncbi:MAG: succinate dehydrogenase assembly factor 2 [Holosporales bacterium]